MRMNAADPPVRLHLNGVQVLGQYHGGRRAGTPRRCSKDCPTTCQCPQGLLLSGTAQVCFDDGHEELVEAGQISYWPPGHTAWTINGFESIRISPDAAMQHILDHIEATLASASGHR